MPGWDLGSFLVVVGIAWLWLDSLAARDAAVQAAREACEAEGLQFLDDTVAIAAMRPARDADGRLTLQRAYDFEYSDTGNNRIRGNIVMRGREVILLNVGFRNAQQGGSQPTTLSDAQGRTLAPLPKVGGEDVDCP